MIVPVIHWDFSTISTIVIVYIVTDTYLEYLRITFGKTLFTQSAGKHFFGHSK